MKYKLYKKDVKKFLRVSDDIRWIKRENDSEPYTIFTEPQIGSMLLMSPFNDYFTWETTTIDEIISSTSDEVEPKTYRPFHGLEL